MPSKDALLNFMRESAYRPLTAAELAEVFAVQDDDKPLLKRLLRELEEDGEIVRTRTARYGLPERMNLVVGIFQGHMKGFGFVIPDHQEDDDLFVPPEEQNGAMHGDRVVARVAGQARDGRRREGEIIRILKRATTRVVGLLERHRGHGFVVPDDKRFAHDIYVAKADLNNARTGEKVVVEITSWPSARRGAEGKVVERLGIQGEPGVDMLSLMVRHNLRADFPDEVLAELAQIPEQVGPEDVAGRWDLRDKLIFTIDGEDAKDLDDAVSLEPGKGRAKWRLGVHIADVSYYVREGTALDREARERGTSVYLVDRVIPMLPPKLSNGICSLHGGVDRLTMTVFMDFDPEGNRVGYEMGLSVIHSKRRMTYTEVQAILDGNEPTEVLPAHLATTLRQMHELAQLLHGRRRERGSIDFDLPEPRVLLNEHGVPQGVERREHNLAHQLIEEFMLAANETVAQHYLTLSVPFLYRVHELPDEERVQQFEEFLFNFGIPFKAGREVSPKAFQQVLERIAGREEEKLISSVMLRTMRQARYATEPLGHFGLAARFYTHFTSPIRRYPDLQIHRIMREVMERGRLSAKRVGVLLRELPSVALHSSQMERRAMEVERESVTLKMLQYMADKVGEEYPGIVSGVTAFGVFVQLPNMVEGLVHVSTLTDDYYQFHEKHYALIGERTGKRYRLGDHVRVKVERVSLEQRQMDLSLVTASDSRRSGRQRQASTESGAGGDKKSRSRAGKKAALTAVVGAPVQAPSAKKQQKKPKTANQQAASPHALEPVSTPSRNTSKRRRRSRKHKQNAETVTS